MNIEIKILGSNNHNGLKLIKNIRKIKCDVNINIKELNDELSIKKYKIKNTPAIVIDEKVCSEGKILSVKDICKLLTNY